MSDKDHPEREDQPERDTKEPINFEWTPELVKIATSRGAIHPSIGPIDFSKGYADCNYRPGMTLPDPADTRECLRWVGLSDKKIIDLEHKFNDLYPDYEAPSCGYDNEVTTKGISDITFPLIEEMVELFLREVYDNKDEDYDYTTHKGYIERGIELGLRPEFAVFCGLHKDDPRAIAEPHLFEELWFLIKAPAGLIEGTIIPFWMQLKEFMATKLLYEGKAWLSYGRWVVREGETLDQAKARVDDRERQRLKEQAIKKHEEILERKRQAREKEDAEDRARWAEEERQEAEMLKQQSMDKGS
ncbi:unnamed protein product [Penicillium glandicola]